MIKELKYYEDQDYLDELQFRSEIYELDDYVNMQLQELGYKHIRFEHLELKSHYDSYFVKDIQWSKMAAEVIDKRYNELCTDRAFKVILKRYGLDPWTMFTLWKTEAYIELHDNYLPIYINNRLWMIKEAIEDEVNNDEDSLKDLITGIIKEALNNEYLRGSEADYKEYLQNKEG